MFEKAKDLLKLRKQALQLKKQLSAIEVEAEVAKGLVRVKISGDLKLKEINIDSSFLIPEKKAEIERLIKEVINQGLTRAQQAAATKMRELGSNLGFPTL